MNMENGYLSGLLRPAPQAPPASGGPLLPQPQSSPSSWNPGGRRVPQGFSSPSQMTNPSPSQRPLQRPVLPAFDHHRSMYGHHHQQHQQQMAELRIALETSSKSEFKPPFLSPASQVPPNPNDPSSMFGFGFFGPTHPLRHSPREPSPSSPGNLFPLNDSTPSSSFHHPPSSSSSYGSTSFTQALINLSKVSPSRTSVASSTPLTSVTSSQVYKPESGSAFSAPTKVEKSYLSDEEVLVDDFDGQCCRTYPLNHSRIIKWREERKILKVKDSKPPEMGGGIPPLPPSTSSSTPSSSSTSNSAIPVGIAIGRQRQLNEKSANIDASKRNEPAPSSRTNNSTLGRIDPGSSSSSDPSLIHPMGISPQSPWPGNPIHPLWQMERFPESLQFPPHHPGSWPPPPPLGPIPMGYQLAKDPLTGQILLIPTDGAGPPRPSPMWPSPSMHSFDGASSLSQYPPPGHYHPLYLQHHMQYMQQRQQQQQVAQHPLKQFHKPRSVPETINLGSSSEEEDENLRLQSSVLKKLPENKSSEKDVLNVRQLKEEEQPLIVEESSMAVSQPPASTPDKSLVVKKEIRGEEAQEKPCTTPERSKSEIGSTSSLERSVVVKTEIVDPTISIKEEKIDTTSIECIIAEALLSLGEDIYKSKDSYDGFDALIRGLELTIPTLDEESAFDILCRATKHDSMCYGFPTFFDDAYNLDVNLLCAVTAQDYADYLNFLDPLVVLRSKYNLHYYRNESRSREFISMRIKRAEASKDDNGELEKYEGIKSLASVIKKIKNTEIMSQLEVEIRAALVQLQSSYREKQKELSRLKSLSPKKKRSSSSNKRPPGRPKKRKPLKQPGPNKKKKTKPNSDLETEEVSKSSYSDNDADEEDEDDEEEDLSPPILEPATSSTNQSSPPTPTTALVTLPPSNLLKPPKLTASSSLSTPVTNLSTIKARFMKGKENPFANLMKLATTPSNSKPGSTKSGDTDDEDEDVEEEEPSKPSSEGEQTTEEDVRSSSSSNKYSEDTNISINIINKRKSDNPQKHSAQTETLVTKKPKNIFMMNCLKYPSGFGQKKDEYEFDDEEEEEEGEDSSPSPPQPEAKKPSFSEYSGKSHLFQNTPRKDKSSNISSKSPVQKSKNASNNPSPIVVKPPTTSKQNKKSSALPSDSEEGSLRSAKLTAGDLKDGLRLLILNDGRFWPARLNSTRLPDVYGVVMEKQRGNRPQILPRDDILQECIMEVKPQKKDQVPTGTRVCVYWSSAYNCLFPGTVESNESLIQVNLDDGDRRDVDISNVRMLPSNYSHVFHDPDPIATLRKRRQSSDSAEGNNHHPPPSKSHVPAPFKIDSAEGTKQASPIVNKIKRKHKHKHHHRCKKKHKKHKSLRVKLDGTFNNTTTYSIRSPPIYSNNRGGGSIESPRTSSSKMGSSSHISEGEEEEEEEEDDQENDEADEDGDDESSAREDKEEESEDDGDEDSEDNDYSSENNDEPSSKRRTQDKAASKFNPVTGRPLWTWGDEGYRRPGSKGKAKKLFHRTIQRENELLNVGDCAVFLSTARVDRPYIGRVETFWEAWNSGHMMVKVKWFYHPEEIETNGKRVDLKIPGGLFQSPHMDENDVQTISHKCSVLAFKDYPRSLTEGNPKRKKSLNAYYLAGSYEPGSLSVQFLQGVLKS